jgi:hypothetical protein
LQTCSFYCFGILPEFEADKYESYQDGGTTGQVEKPPQVFGFHD